MDNILPKFILLTIALMCLVGCAVTSYPRSHILDASRFTAIDSARTSYRSHFGKPGQHKVYVLGKDGRYHFAYTCD